MITKYISALLYCLIGMSAARAAGTPAGTWRYMNGNATGTMVIKNCTARECDISFNTVNGAHTCDLDNAKLNLKWWHDVVTIRDEFIADCRITIRKKSSDVIDVQAHGPDCQNLCGMRGVFTGRWETATRPYTYNPSFDCDKKTNPTETTICRDATLSAMDREMNTLYKSSKPPRSAQRAWLKNRNACSDDKSCLNTAYTSRIRELVTAITGNEFTLYEYAKSLYDNGYFHPRDAIFIEQYIKDKIGADEYKKFATCVSEFSTTDDTDDYIFAAYGCPGFYTLYESAFYINKNEIWIAYIDYTNDDTRFISIIGPTGRTETDAPAPMSKWISDLKTRTTNSDITFRDKL